MNIYESLEIEKQIESIVEQNEGVITEDQMQALVEAQTSSLTQIENVCKYIKQLEAIVEYAKEEKNRINNRQKQLENRINSIKTFLVDYIKERGKTDAGTFTLYTRETESLQIDETQVKPGYFKQVISFELDKDMIKSGLKNGDTIHGASLVKKTSLVIK